MTIKNKPIGGYFELELPSLFELHTEAIALNGGRFCLEYILKCRKCNKVYVPYFTCDSVMEPIKKLGISYEFYHIDKNYKIKNEINTGEGEALLYTNYWGLQDDYCHKLSKKYKEQLILDYTQAFFSKRIIGIDTFYSCRKFFGVPDGGYLYTDAVSDFEINQDESYKRIDSLVKRIDISPEAGYGDFLQVSDAFQHMSIRRMSKFTKRMMQSIDYRMVAQRRLNNYNFLRKHLGGRQLSYGEVPMIFPYVSEFGQKLRNALIEDKVFIAKYWPNVESWAGKETIETWMSNHILPIPIDQRYGIEEMERIVKLIKKYKL